MQTISLSIRFSPWAKAQIFLLRAALLAAALCRVRLPVRLERRILACAAKVALRGMKCEARSA